MSEDFVPETSSSSCYEEIPITLIHKLKIFQLPLQRTETLRYLSIELLTFIYVIRPPQQFPNNTVAFG
jgi:hypothetical protein